MARTSKYTSIPKKGQSDPQMDAIAANLELLTGQKGQGESRAVLVKDLQELGILKFDRGRLGVGDNVGGGGGGGGGVTPTPPGTIEPPTAPTGFTGNAGFQYISFNWDEPTYVGHSFAEVWTSQTDDFSVATRIGVTPATIFGYSTPRGWEGYGWCRFVNQLGAVGPLNDANGTYVKTATDVDSILDDLVDSIGEVHLDFDLDHQIEHLYDYQEFIETRKAENALEEAVTGDRQKTEARVEDKDIRSWVATEYYTAVSADEAIAKATTELKAEIEDPDGTSIGATLINDYYTRADADGAIAVATTTLKSEIEDPDGTSVGATLQHQYYTKVDADEAIASATDTLKSDIEDPDGTSLGAHLSNNYYTKAAANQAISIATLNMKAQIEDPNGSSLGATLSNQYYTKTAANQAIAAADLILKGEIEDPNGNSLGATLRNNYFTDVQTNQAISAATTTLKSQIEDPNGSSLGATLYKDYYTKTNTNQAISAATTSLKSQIEDPNGNSLGASLDTVSSTLTEVDGYQQALWGVKATAGNITASVGLVAKSNPNNPDINNAVFIVKDADFRVLYSTGQGSQKKAAPIFGTINNPDYGSVPGAAPKILAIDTAYIKVANIKDLVAGDIVADSIVSNSTIQSPNIIGGQITVGSNFKVTSNGNMTFNNFVGQNGTLTGRMTIGSAYIDGDNSPSSNKFISSGGGSFYVTHAGYLYANKGIFRGTIYAENIEGDISSMRFYNAPRKQLTKGSWTTLKQIKVVNAYPYERVLGFNYAALSATVSAVPNQSASMRATFRIIRGSTNVYTKSVTASVSGGPGGGSDTASVALRDYIVTIPANWSGTVEIRGIIDSDTGQGNNKAYIYGLQDSAGGSITATISKETGDLA